MLLKIAYYAYIRSYINALVCLNYAGIIGSSLLCTDLQKFTNAEEIVVYGEKASYHVEYI